MPEPYNRTQLRELRTRLDERWPRLPLDEAEKWLPRFKEERSPYSRVRCHGVRLQVDCIVALAFWPRSPNGVVSRTRVTMSSRALASGGYGLVWRPRSPDV